jgi:hypothetical protein
MLRLKWNLRLKTKTSTFIWALIFGLFLDTIVIYLSLIANTLCPSGFGGMFNYYEINVGFPFSWSFVNQYICNGNFFPYNQLPFSQLYFSTPLLADLVFWMLISYVVLNVIREFKSKSNTKT